MSAGNLLSTMLTVLMVVISFTKTDPQQIPKATFHDLYEFNESSVLSFFDGFYSLHSVDNRIGQFRRVTVLLV